MTNKINKTTVKKGYKISGSLLDHIMQLHPLEKHCLYRNQSHSYNVNLTFWALTLHKRCTKKTLFNLQYFFILVVTLPNICYRISGLVFFALSILNLGF